MKRLHGKRFRIKPITGIVLVLFVLWGFFCFCESRVKLLPPEYMNAAAATFAEERINALMQERLTGITGVYEMQTGEDGRVTVVNTDPVALGKLKAGLAAQLNQSLNGTQRTFIPIGSLFNYGLLNGMGFSIPVHLYFTGSAKVSVESEIISAGVNQSKYRLVARVQAQLCSTSLTVPGNYSYSGDYLLCEAVLLGEVPLISR